MQQLALRSVISHQSVFVISVFITCNKTLLPGLVVGVISAGMLVTSWGSRRLLHLPPDTHEQCHRGVCSRSWPPRPVSFLTGLSRCWHTVFLRLCWIYQTNYYEVPHKYMQRPQFNHFPGVPPGKITSDELPWNIKEPLVVHCHDLSSCSANRFSLSAQNSIISRPGWKIKVRRTSDTGAER